MPFQNILAFIGIILLGDACPKPPAANQPSFRPTSCLDYLLRGASKCGIYKLYDSKSGNSFPAYCDMKSEYNSPVNENAPNWNLYCLSLARMRSLQAHSTHRGATCSYPTYGIFKDFNIVDFLGDRHCKKVEYINIRGHVGTHLTVPFWQRLNSYTLHIDSTYTHCPFKTMKTGAVSGEDNFGFYGSINPKFRYTHSHQSTTQWWFGAHM